MGDREEGNVVPEPIVCPTESKERTTESVTQEYKFIFPFFLAPFLAVTFLVILLKQLLMLPSTRKQNNFFTSQINQQASSKGKMLEYATDHDVITQQSSYNLLKIISFYSQ